MKIVVLGLRTLVPVLLAITWNSSSAQTLEPTLVVHTATHGTFVLQPPLQDTTLSSTGGVVGTEAWAFARYRPGNWESRVVVQFSLASLPASAVIQSASLRLFAIRTSEFGTNTLYAAPVTNPWDEAAADWRFREVGVPWTTEGGDFSTATQAQTVVPNLYPDEPNNGLYERWIEWDVTTLVDDWWTGTTPNHGFCIYQDQSIPGGDNQEIWFASREASTADLDYFQLGDAVPSCPDEDVYIHNPGVEKRFDVNASQVVAAASSGASLSFDYMHASSPSIDVRFNGTLLPGNPTGNTNCEGYLRYSADVAGLLVAGANYVEIFDDGNPVNYALVGDITLSLPLSGLLVDVVQSTSQAALAGATVRLERNSSLVAEATTDAAGQAFFGELTAGNVVVQAEFGGQSSPRRLVSLGAQGGSTALEVPTNTILEGRVVDARNARAIPGAVVTLLRNGAPLFVDTTDRQGWYLFSVDGTGSYSVEAFKTAMVGHQERTAYDLGTSSPLTVSTPGTYLIPELALESRVVVLVHGINSDHDAWDAQGDGESSFVDALEAAGWVPLGTIDLPGQGPKGVGTAHIQVQAVALREHLLELVEEGIRSLWIVAHSQGGLVSRYYLEGWLGDKTLLDGLRPEDLVSGVVTLGTPHHGSPLASDPVILRGLLCDFQFPFLCLEDNSVQVVHGLYPSLQALVPGSDTLNRLNRGDPDSSDWTGQCSDPIAAEVNLQAIPYATISGGVPLAPNDWEEFFHRLGANALPCASDGVVPRVSSILHATGPTIANYETQAPIIHTRLTEDSVIQSAVITLLETDPASWPKQPTQQPALRKTTDPWAQLASGQVELDSPADVVVPLVVDPADTLVVDWIWGGGAVDLLLETPGGATLDSLAEAQDPDLDRTVGPGFGTWRVDTPVAGTWNLRFRPTGATPAEALHAARAHGAVVLEFDAFRQNNDVDLVAELTSGTPLTNVTVSAVVTPPSGVDTTVPLLDDGVAPDAVAADGQYTARVALEPAIGVTTFDLSATGDAGSAFVRSRVQAVSVMGQADVGIENPGLTVTSSTGLVGGVVDLDAVVSNAGPEDTLVEVSFWRDDTLEQLESVQVSLTAGSSAAVSASHVPLEVDQFRYSVRATVIDENVDGDPSDNGASASVLVGDIVTGVERPGSGPDDPPRLSSPLAAYPNPFNPRIRIAYSVPRTGPVALDIYDLRGRRVRNLVRGVQPRGDFLATWDGRDGSGSEVASAVYVVRLKVGGDVHRRKVSLVR